MLCGAVIRLWDGVDDDDDEMDLNLNSNGGTGLNDLWSGVRL